MSGTRGAGALQQPFRNAVFLSSISKYILYGVTYACSEASTHCNDGDLCLDHIGSGGQRFPQRVVKIVVPFGAGGLTDILARAMAQDLAKMWGQPVIVENKPGASGAIAASYVAK